MKKVYHSADSRGTSRLDWLDSRHTFSFADYYCPERISFGTLRVLNDDMIKGGMGFGTHPHQDMEIISIPIKGGLLHKDSTGHEEIISENEVQVMSAGTGIMHSEYNASLTEEAHFLQVWILPLSKGVKPRYDQKIFSISRDKSGIHLIVAPMNSKEDVLEINQNAFISKGILKSGESIDYVRYSKSNGIYIFLIDGELLIEGQIIRSRDGFGLYNKNEIQLNVIRDSEFLVLEVPMS
ncbi:pirin family protein [Marinifilum sp. N1E240]|uniref:pirin family protein n=1 Tax=Marinifilum sp. N1E240 TaxID=2608082 RepID=UPI00128C0E7D|nr:pirin family protein [Marinifilum sp. N1E240]MPQ47487.1 pirin family protein [Marinifilum sp. N1E240]